MLLKIVVFCFVFVVVIIVAITVNVKQAGYLNANEFSSVIREIKLSMQDHYLRLTLIITT